MNEIMNELIEEIQKDSWYLSFKDKSKLLLKKETNELLERYQETLNEINDLKKYEGYIDLTSKKEELKEIKKQMTSNQDIQEYYQSYYEINRLLDHVTQIIFKDISQILDTTGYKLWELLQENIKKDN